MIISCGAVVFFEGKVILVHHKQGHWSFPKGKAEPGESEEETARREIKEETCLDVDFIKGFRREILYRLGKNRKKAVYFAARARDGNAVCQFDELQDARWFKYDEALNMLNYEDAKKILMEAIEHERDSRQVQQEE